jgi:DNA-binding LacI/PurR family transcriptional regulator
MAHEVDGILLTTRRKSIYGSKIYELLYEQHTPTVLLHDVYDSKLPIIDVNNYMGGTLAAEHLLKHSKSNLSVIVGEHGFRADDLRLEGFLDTLRQKDVDVDTRCHVFRYSFGTENTAFDEGYKLGMSLAIKNLKIDGIFLFNDLIAMGFQKAMLERGISIPDDIRIIGFDNIERCTEARIPLTTIEVPRYEIGLKAYDILKTFMREGYSKVPPRTLLDPTLIIRESA